MAELTPEAKAEIAEAIRIVREDRQYAMLRDIHSTTKNPPGNGGGSPPAPGSGGNPAGNSGGSSGPGTGGNPPPTPPPPQDPPTDPPKVGLWWGDRLGDNK